MKEIIMTMQFLPVSHGMRAQIEACQRATWFVFESLEREHLIAVKSLSATAPAIGLGWWVALQSLALVLRGPAAVIGSDRATRRVPSGSS
jgi:hypothetical protein